MICASQFGHAGIVDILINSQCQIDAVNNDGDSALMQAARYGHYDSAATLLAARAESRTINLYFSNPCNWQEEVASMPSLVL